MIQSRVLVVDQAYMKEFVDGASKKTKLYNSKKVRSNYLIFRIITGNHVQKFVSMQVVDSINEFDIVDTEGKNYWRNKVGPLHKSIGNRIWSMSNGMSYYVEKMKGLIIEEYSTIILMILEQKTFGDLESVLKKQW